MQTAKNAMLPVLAATILAEGECVLRRVPPLYDVHVMCQLLLRLGVQVRLREPGTLHVTPAEQLRCETPHELVRRMRASVLVMGPLLARMGRARVSLPGGCAIGNRPVDLHLRGLEALGATFTVRYGFIEGAADGLRGARVYLDYPSVTATENVMMAAARAEGTTVIENAAGEPEVVDLAAFLQGLGARIKGAGSRVIEVEGVERLGGTEHTCIPDRIEAGTYLLAGAISGGDVAVRGVVPEHLTPLLAKLEETGAAVSAGPGTVRVRGASRPRAADVKTLPYPGFPSDLQAPMMAYLAVADGISIFTETVFENRFLHVEELKRMGADIRVEGATAVVRGMPGLTGAPVRATDLRAGAALVLAGLRAQGETRVGGVAHVDRGYVNLVGKMASLGADIRRVDE